MMTGERKQAASPYRCNVVKVCFDCHYCCENPEPHPFAEIWKCGKTGDVLHAPNCEGGIPENCPLPSHSALQQVPEPIPYPKSCEVCPCKRGWNGEEEFPDDNYYPCTACPNNPEYPTKLQDALKRSKEYEAAIAAAAIRQERERIRDAFIKYDKGFHWELVTEDILAIIDEVK